MNLRKLFFKRKRSIFYHITPPENVGSVLQNGLLADVFGCIYVFRDEKFNGLGFSLIADYIAANTCEQRFNGKDYALFRVYVAEKDLILDNSPENLQPEFITYKRQYIIQTPEIKPKNVEFLGVYHNGYTKLPKCMAAPGFLFEETELARLFRELAQQLAEQQYKELTGETKPKINVRQLNFLK